MGKVGAFLEHGREAHKERPCGERLGDFREVAVPLDDKNQRVQASRCMMCGVAFCQAGVGFGRARVSGCPLHNLIPEWNDLVYRGLWDEAAARMRVTNPFPEFTGRVCPALCEAACNLGRDRGATTIRDDERAISDHEWASGGPAPLEPTGELAGRKVAVVGSGPAGLACAWELARRGAFVCVVEKSDRAGGLLRYGIPAMKLPKPVVQRRVDWMGEQGVAFSLLTDASDPAVAQRLMDEHDAVVIAAGAGQARGLSAPGADLAGVHLAVEYLTASTKAVEAAGGDEEAAAVAGLVPEALCARGKDVVVIGGGDTGTDCVATALRQGARSVRQLEFMPEPPAHRLPGNPWPEWPFERKDDYGQQEAAFEQGADPRTFAVDTRELVAGDYGGVAALRCVRLDWSQGRPEPVPGSEETLPAQLVLVATGFTGPRADVLEAFGAERPSREQAAAGEHRARADAPVFVCGDARNGATLVVTAMEDGLACARQLAEELA